MGTNKYSNSIWNVLAVGVPCDNIYEGWANMNYNL